MKFKYNDKILDSIAMGIHPKVQLHVYEGAIRSSKTATAIQELFLAIQQSDELLHCIAAVDLDAIRENILNNEVGMITQYPKYCNLKKEKIGGYYLEVKCNVPGKPKLKRVLLASYSDSSKWKKILGKTLGVIFIDEVNIADKAFVDECFARQASCSNPLQIWTLNGDAPSHWVYQDYINRCKPLGNIPLSILNDMKNRVIEKGWYYQHWTMWDNPVMDEEKIRRASSIYPVGSYYYKTKILGERGTPGKLIYNEYMTEEKHLKDRLITIYPKYIVGVDIGGNGATNSISLIGYTNNFSEICVVDKIQFKQCGWDEKKKILFDTIISWKQEGKYIECISVDSAEDNFIRDLKTLFASHSIQVVASYKATIKQRIDMGIILLSSGILIFNNTQAGRDAYQCFLQAVWVDGKEGIEREDLNLPLNDAIDSIEYALTVHMKQILLTVRRTY